jgi:hypothetical protein
METDRRGDRSAGPLSPFAIVGGLVTVFVDTAP